MQLLTTTGIEIDVENSQKYNGIYITEGKFDGLNVSGTFLKTLVNFTCTNEGRHNVQIYVNVKSGYVTLEELPVEESCIPQAFHIGGLDIDCDGCGNFKIYDLLLPENPCIAYARPFSSAFGLGFNKVQAQYDICAIVAGMNEFNKDYNCDYAIQGTDSICPEEFYTYAGNNGLYIGGDDLYDGNTPNPTPNT